jgi:hypothetical protein
MKKTVQISKEGLNHPPPPWWATTYNSLKVKRTFEDGESLLLTKKPPNKSQISFFNDLKKQR